jgi:3-hydroxyisobutyrate dehydrogenase-like beta-hydroxyacid dehydrogenase
MVTGILHPGAMGSALARQLRGRGERVLWVSEGRSAATRERAAQAEIEDAGTVAELVQRAELVIAICPPHAALDVADQVRAAAPGRLLYVDANAISTGTAREVAARFAGTAVDVVDGGVIGPPPVREGVTRLYLSGERAGEVQARFAGTWVEAHVLPGEVGAASAAKAIYASYTKGHAALIYAIRALARAEGVEGALLAEWGRDFPELLERTRRGAPVIARKAWRFAGEMQEHARTWEAAGLTPALMEGAAWVYERLTGLEAEEDVDLDLLLAELARG